MQKITLKDTENQSISKIVDKYRELEKNLDNVQSRLEELDKEKTVLLSTLDAIRNEETLFFKKMKKSYGEGKLDLMTMEYVTLK